MTLLDLHSCLSNVDEHMTDSQEYMNFNVWKGIFQASLLIMYFNPIILPANECVYLCDFEIYTPPDMLQPAGNL